MAVSVILLIGGGFLVWFASEFGYERALPFILTVVICPISLTALSGYGLCRRRPWAPALTMAVGVAWMLLLLPIALHLAMLTREYARALAAFLGAIYGLICVLIMLDRANREEFA